jgi:hypothetical protein
VAEFKRLVLVPRKIVGGATVEADDNVD